MKELRKHQNEACNAIKNNNNNKGIICSPTGSGKSLMQSRTIIDDIKSSDTPGVYVILSPRILLTNQLLGDIREDLDKQKIDCQYLVVNSNIGANHDAPEEQFIQSGMDYRETPTTTSHKKITETYEKSVDQKIPLIITSTYHSTDSIKDSGIPIKMVLCDEAHHLVTTQFNWIVTDSLPAYNKFFFTATKRVTPSKDGIGMSNDELFGGTIYQTLPIDMINAGEIVRPRMHLIDMTDHPEGDEADGLAVSQAFLEHNSLTNVGAKLLVGAKGTEHLNFIVNHSAIQNMMHVRPSLTVFDISSEYGSRIDGEKVERADFLERLRTLKDSDEAIIVHINILTEGIDVPGITGVMPMNAQGKAKFLQTLGRATRLHGDDRSALYDERMSAGELNSFVKPYAYVIIPVYGDLGKDLSENIKNIVTELRGYGFDPSQDIVTKEKRGKSVPVVIDVVTSVSEQMRSVLDFTTNVIHEVEEEEKANELYGEQIELDLLAKQNEEDFWKALDL